MRNYVTFIITVIAASLLLDEWMTEPKEKSAILTITAWLMIAGAAILWAVW